MQKPKLHGFRGRKRRMRISLGKKDGNGIVNGKRTRFKKPFSAFKEMEKNQSTGKNQGRNKGGNKQGRRGRRDDRPRDRSRSPRQTVEDSEKNSAAVDAVAGQKRPHESSDCGRSTFSL